MTDTRQALAALVADNERLRIALRFYARGEHYNTDDSEEFDTVSGEPQNWLCSGREDSSTMIENGQVARCALLGKEINWIDGDEDSTPQPIYGEPDRAALSAQPVAGAVAQPVAWRCFHCDETFTDTAAAQEHFGPSEHDKPACQMDIGYVRWLLEQHRRNVDDDSDALRTVRSLAGEHETLRRRAEEQGYARGLADAKKHPEELGLIATPQAAPAPAPEPSAQAVAHPSHQTVREWMPVSEALRLSDLWTAGDLDNCGQWRAAIKVLADEVRALAASPQPEPSAQGEPVACDRDAPVCPWCDRQGLDICQHADDARTCGK